METLEVICAPYAVWLAPTGEMFPDVDQDPTGGWDLLGTSGTRSYDDKGVAMTFDETLGKWKPAGNTGNRKVWRTDESVTLGVDVADMSIETFAKAMNDATVTTVPRGTGVPGTKSIPLLKGTDVAQFAALVRGASPEEADMVAQFELPVVYQDGQLKPVYSKQGTAMLGFNLVTLEDDDLGFGQYVAQFADAS